MKKVEEIKTPIRELTELINRCGGAILYTPFTDEIDYSDNSFPFIIHQNRILLPSTKITDPYAWAGTCISIYRDKNPFILIPGKHFDIYGTRHGKGGGWYDRFLSKVPRTWLRIGIATVDEFSEERLSRESWDESMDWLLIQYKSEWIPSKVS